MLKKKNIAMMTAIAAVATSAAPAFAAVQEQYLNEESLIAEVERLFDVKYSNELVTGEPEGTNSVYRVMAILNAGTPEEVTSISQLKGLIEEGKVEGNTLKLEVFDKGHRTDAKGNIVDKEVNQYVKNTTASLTTAQTLAETMEDGIVTTVATTTNATTSDLETVTITLANEDIDPIVLTKDNYQLDLTKPVDAEGNVITTGATAGLARKVVGFKTLEDGVEKSNDIPTKLVNVIDFRENGVTKIQKDISAYVNEEGYTEEGAALINMLAECTTGSTTTSVVYEGKKYEITYDHNRAGNPDLGNVEVSKDGGYQLVIEFNAKLDIAKNVRSIKNNIASDRNVQITVTSKSQKALENFKTAASAGLTVSAGGQGEYTTLAGDDRFETAIAISKESFDSKDDASATATASSIVLVGEDAIVDGLAAAPLAKQKGAPVLLTKKDAVGDTTLAEIKRLVEKDSTIYLVGGESVISKEVEKQLIKEMNAKIVRLAGDDRNETSIEIAKEMVKGSTVGTAFVVGADGEADAMSIAAQAVQQTTGTTVAPIIVNPADKLTVSAKHFLELNKVSEVDVIGGEGKVSTQVLKDIKAITKKTVDRVAGDSRHETNADVIEKYYSATSASTVFVAKDGYVGGNGKLIDALAVAPLAGKLDAPIVLATEDLAGAQDLAVKKVFKSNGSEKLYKAGNGISSTVMSKLAKIMGLNK